MVRRPHARSPRRAARALALAALASLACAPGGSGGEGGASSSEAAKGEPAATVDGETITVGELDAWIKERLFERATDDGNPTKLHEMRSQALDDLIRERLVAREAEAQGTTSEALLEEKSQAASGETVTDAQVRRFYESNEERLGGVPFEKVAPQIRKHLEGRAGPDAARQYAQSLREEADVTVHLEAPRVEVAATGASRGPEGAPVTVVEFSDYECPYCRRVEPTLEKLRERYPDQVQFVYRHFPLDQVHEKARRAAEAAECAEAQGSFWSYHDLLFEKSPDLGPEKLKEYAKQAGLDMEAFTPCFEERRFREKVEQDLQAGRAAGVTGTPAFFVNGIPLSGAQPLDEFVQLIEKELTRTGAASPEAAASEEAAG